jgi:hypothetical protein
MEGYGIEALPGLGSGVTAETVGDNPIRSWLPTLQRVARNVKRWREDNQLLRWTRQLQALNANRHFSLGGPDSEVTVAYRVCESKCDSSEDLEITVRESTVHNFVHGDRSKRS